MGPRSSSRPLLPKSDLSRRCSQGAGGNRSRIARRTVMSAARPDRLLVHAAGVGQVVFISAATAYGGWLVLIATATCPFWPATGPRAQ